MKGPCDLAFIQSVNETITCQRSRQRSDVTTSDVTRNEKEDGKV